MDIPYWYFPRAWGSISHLALYLEDGGIHYLTISLLLKKTVFMSLGLFLFLLTTIRTYATS